MSSSPSSLPSGWAAVFDATYQRYYYVNASQGLSQWEPPPMPPTTELKPLEASTTQQQQQHPHRQTTSAACNHTDAPTLRSTAIQCNATGAQQFWYHDPNGNLRGPFSRQQLAQWRPFLPMDLMLLPVPQVAVTVTGGSSSCSSDGAHTALELIHVERSSTAATEAPGEEHTHIHQQQQQQHPTSDSQQHLQGSGSQQQQQQQDNWQQGQAQDEQQELTNFNSPGVQGVVPVPAAAAPGAHETSATGHAGTAVAARGAAAAALAPTSDQPHQGHQDSSCTSSSGSQMRGPYLADLLEDSHLLRSWQQSMSMQQQQQQQWPPKAGAPPAPVWQSWCNSCSDDHSCGSRTAHGHQWQQQQQQQHASKLDQVLGSVKSSATAAVAAASKARTSTSTSSGFDKYAAAVLLGLPPHDEAVQLASLAAAHGRSLQEVLQSAAASSAAPAAPAASDDRITYEQRPGLGGVLLVKDPRSGRLTAAGSAAAGAAAATARDSAADLYGDLARWCDPKELEQSLQKASKVKKQAKDRQQQPPPLQALAGAGGRSRAAAAAGNGSVAGGNKRMRLSI